MKPFRFGTIFDVPLWLHPVPLALCPLLAVPCAIRDPLAAVLLVAVMIASILAHELGHAFAARSAGLRVEAIHHRGWSGFCVHEDPGRRTKTRCRVLLAGPLVNFLIAGALLPLALSLPERSYAASVIGAAAAMNAAMGIGNLLPIPPLDGGQILFALLWSRWPEREATLVTAGIGTVLSIPAALVAFAMLVSGVPIAGFALWSLNWSVFKRAWQDGRSPGPSRNRPISNRSPVAETERLMAVILAEQSRRNAERRRRARAP